MDMMKTAEGPQRVEFFRGNRMWTRFSEGSAKSDLINKTTKEARTYE